MNKSFAFVVSTSIVLTACTSNQPESQVIETQAAEVTITAAATEASYMDCGWEWHSEPLPDHSAEVEAVLEEAGFENVSVRATAFGENCITADGVVNRFAAMQTDYDIIIGPAMPEGSNVFDLIYQIAEVLVTHFPVDESPGPNPGRVTLLFEAPPDMSISAVFDYRAAQEAYDQGLTGDEFITALGLDIEQE